MKTDHVCFGVVCDLIYCIFFELKLIKKSGTHVACNGLQPEAICGYPVFPWCGKGCRLWNRCWPVKIQSCCTTYTTRWSWRLGDMFWSFLFRWRDGAWLMRFSQKRMPVHNTHAYTCQLESSPTKITVLDSICGHGHDTSHEMYLHVH